MSAVLFPTVPLGMGGSHYGLDAAPGTEVQLAAALEAALEGGITHFDTATDYAGGDSERRLGRFLAAAPGRRERVFLASKANLNEVSAAAVTRAIDASLQRLRTDVIDVYYLHWPRTGQEMRPWMEGLETARAQGKVRAVGVSNFSVGQMRQLAEVGRIDACQVGYNLLWRFPERGVLPYCRDHGIAVVAYSALAHGILAGRYGRQLRFAPGDQRWSISLFRPDVWPRVHALVGTLTAAAARAGVPPATLALRWLIDRQGVDAVLVSAHRADQVHANLEALRTPVPADALAELDALGAQALTIIPDEGNPFGYHP